MPAAMAKSDLAPICGAVTVSETMRVSVWLFWLAQFAAADGATAADVAVVGLFPGKAVLVVDGAAPRTIGIGNPWHPAH